MRCAGNGGVDSKRAVTARRTVRRLDDGDMRRTWGGGSRGARPGGTAGIVTPIPRGRHARARGICSRAVAAVAGGADRGGGGGRGGNARRFAAPEESAHASAPSGRGEPGWIVQLSLDAVGRQLAQVLEQVR